MKISGRTILFLFLLIIVSSASKAAPGDTLKVQTFTFGSPLEGKFLFPDSTHRWEKILMYYTLKCNPSQSPACGEWDYLTYTYLWKHTGRYDSTLYSHPSFTYNGSTPDTLLYMNSASWNYFPWFEYFNQTIPADTALTGTSDSTIAPPFSSLAKDSRTQILWKKDELLSAGLTPGQITGIRFNFESSGTLLKKLRIRLMAEDSLSQGKFHEGPFTEVFLRDHLFSGSGWQTISFTYPFQWDGSSGIIADISYEDKTGSEQNLVFAGDAGFSALLNSGNKDFNLNFRDNDFVKIPGAAFSPVDSAVTVAFWCFGDPLKQPQNNTIFEGIDSAGQRVLNVHLPWSDGKVYWDAGRDANGYDRLFQALEPENYSGKWNHWAFVKDVRESRMKLYLNGQLIRTMIGKRKSMKGIRTFRIGSEGNGNDLFYDGMVDDFSVWNIALNDSAIREFMYKDISPDDPHRTNLIAWYKFDEEEGTYAADSSGNQNEGLLRGFPDHLSYKGRDRFRNVTSSQIRPQVVFEQGVYDPSSLDSLMKIDTVAKSPMMIILYDDTIHPWIATDTITRWPAYYAGFVYDSLGNPVDSSFVPNDGILVRKDNTYYGEPFEVLDRYELARYITPYGNNLSLGNGWTWIYDLTDYAPLLHDSVHLSSGNWQELLDMKFMMIEGIPPRDVISVENIYTGGHGYASADQHNLPPVTRYIPSDVSDARLKMRITGHGFGGNLNCAEFCARTNKVLINGDQKFTHTVWRQCGSNPLYPQGGTWLYDRAAWCPGAEVGTQNFELTPFITPGDSLKIDYDLQDYTWNGQGSWPYYQIESQLITYKAPNFSLDAAIQEIIAPNNIQNYNRFNPMCGSPVIVIQNNGSTELDSLDIVYGPSGGKMQTYKWEGNLHFQDTTQVTLPPVDWSGWPGEDNRFIFTVEKPNGGADEYTPDNSMTSFFTLPPVYENRFIFKFKTNHAAPSLSWILEDETGNVLYRNGELDYNTVYIDTFNLTTGCYRLMISNAEGEGLSYWANMPPYGSGTAGYARLMDMDGTTFKQIQPDFGSFTQQSFTVGMNINVNEINPAGYLKVYPNPAQGEFFAGIVLDHPADIEIMVTDAMGRRVYYKEIKDITTETVRIDLSERQPGVYLVSLKTSKGVTTKKILIF